MPLLRSIDHSLFHWVNSVATCPVLDAVMPFLSNPYRVPVCVWVMVPAGLGAWLYVGRRRAAQALAGLLATVGAADLVAYRVIKQVVGRLRPEYAGIPVILRESSHGKFGFPSNHAVNCFAAAGFLGTLYPGARVPLYLVAVLVAYSRVYVGAHYPADVLFGAAFGLAAGLLAARSFRKICPER